MRVSLKAGQFVQKNHSSPPGFHIYYSLWREYECRVDVGVNAHRCDCSRSVLFARYAKPCLTRSYTFLKASWLGNVLRIFNNVTYHYR